MSFQLNSGYSVDRSVAVIEKVLNWVFLAVLLDYLLPTLSYPVIGLLVASSTELSSCRFLPEFIVLLIPWIEVSSQWGVFEVSP